MKSSPTNSAPASFAPVSPPTLPTAEPTRIFSSDTENAAAVQESQSTTADGSRPTLPPSEGAANASATVDSEHAEKESAPSSVSGQSPTTPLTSTPTKDVVPTSGAPEYWQDFTRELRSMPTADVGGAPAATLPAHGATSATFGLVRTLAALVVVLALLVLTLYGLKRWMGAASPTSYGTQGQILSRLYLTPKIALYFVRVGPKVLVLSLGPTGATFLCEMSYTDFVSGSEVAQREKFAPVLEAYLQSPASDANESLSVLRQEVERLQRQIREESGGADA